MTAGLLTAVTSWKGAAGALLFRVMLAGTLKKGLLQVAVYSRMRSSRSLLLPMSVRSRLSCSLSRPSGCFSA